MREPKEGSHYREGGQPAPPTSFGREDSDRGLGEQRFSTRWETRREGEVPRWRSRISRPRGSGGEDFQAKEAFSNLTEAQNGAERITQELGSLSDQNKAVAAEVIDETETLSRLLKAVNDLLASGQPVPPGLAVSVTVQVELVQEAAKRTEERADEELKGILQSILDRAGWIGRKLLSMNLHLFPVKEWTLGGEVSALIVKGKISVTFGRRA